MTSIPDVGALPQSLATKRFWEIVGDRETGTIEFKEQLPRAGKLQEPLVAFANARGGTTVVGVSKARPHGILGARWSQDADERVQEAARATQPPLQVRVASIRVGDVQVVFLQVDPIDGGWVQTSDGRLLVRAGPTNRALVGTELARFIQERGSAPAEDQPVRGPSLTDLDSELLGRYLRHRLGRSRIGRERALKGLGLLDSEGRMRLACLMLFGKHPQAADRRFGIAVLRFEGSFAAEPTLRDRTQLLGPLVELVGEADRRIYDEMRRNAVVRGLVREEVPEFPAVAVREALVNAVGHRDYSARGAAVEVRIYDDALEIESPGTLPGGVTVENIAHAQYSRNVRIMDGLQRLGLVEEAGQGIGRMIAEMENALLDPPQFEERGSSFVVRLRGTTVFAAEDRLWMSLFADLKLDAHAKIALVFVRRNGSIGNEDLRNLRNLDRDASRGVLQGLVAMGLLAAVGRGRGARYVLGRAATTASRPTTLDEQLQAVLNHARRQGSIANADVRGLLADVDRQRARSILYELVGRGMLRAEGERRGRRYLPVRNGELP